MQRTISSPTGAVQLAALTFLSWLGSYIHTTMELALPVWRAENSIPAIVGFALFLGWWRQPKQRQRWARMLLVWTAGGHLLLGAILSVLPLELWPFAPEQSLSHYVSHLIYALAQVPLIAVLLLQIRKDEV